METFQMVAGICSITSLAIALVTLSRVVRLEKLYANTQSLAARDITSSQVAQTTQNK